MMLTRNLLAVARRNCPYADHRRSAHTYIIERAAFTRSTTFTTTASQTCPPATTITDQLTMNMILNTLK